MPDREPVAIVIHSLAQAVAALSAAAEAGRPVVIASAPDAGINAGPGWFREVLHGAHKAVPMAQFSSLLDCGDDAGAAMAALRAGLEAIVFTGPAEVAARLNDILAQAGARLQSAPVSTATSVRTPTTTRRRTSRVTTRRGSGNSRRC